MSHRQDAKTQAYFQALRIQIRAGRGITTDTAKSRPVILINEALARAYVGTANPVGLEMNRGASSGSSGTSGRFTSIAPRRRRFIIRSRRTGRNSQTSA